MEKSIVQHYVVFLFRVFLLPLDKKTEELVQLLFHPRHVCTCTFLISLLTVCHVSFLPPPPTWLAVFLQNANS